MTVTERETEIINLKKETRKKKIWDKKKNGRESRGGVVRQTVTALPVSRGILRKRDSYPSTTRARERSLPR